MPDENPPTPEPPPPEQATSALLGKVAPDEMFARGMQSVKMTNGAAGGWQPPSIGECARLFPGYEVLKLLGRGGMGAVYQARQIELDRLVAIKLLPLEISVDKEFADRFRREARAMARLEHPNIIAVHDFGTTSEGHLYFVMAYVDGANLADVIHRVGLTGEQALSIVEQVCTALAYAHSKGIVHRDMKPANVMIDTESQVKVADFGLARLTDPSAEKMGHTMTGTVMGTPDYMAPEQMKGMNVDHRADIYSLGVMVYEMFCKEVPRGAFEPPSVRGGCDPRIDPIVIKAMQPNPDRRYQTTPEMKVDVVAARTPLPGVVGRVSSRATAGGDTGPTPPARSPKKPATPGARQPPGQGDGPAGPTETQAALATTDAAAKKRRPVAPLALGGFALLAAIAALVHFAPWKKDSANPGGTRSSVSQTTPDPAEQDVVPGVNDPGGPPPASSAPPPTARVSPSTEPWQDVLHDPAKLVLSGAVERTPEGLQFTKKGDAILLLGEGPRRDGAIRMRATFGGLRVGLRARINDAAGSYRLFAMEKEIQLGRYDLVTKQYTNLHDFGLREPLQPEQEYEIELRLLGQTLTAKFNGEILGTVTDGTFTEGDFGAGTGDRDAAPVLVKSLEVLDLDAPSGAAPPTTAYLQPPKWNDVTDRLRSALVANEVSAAEGEWLKATKAFTASMSVAPVRNAILRVIFSGRVDLALRRVHQDGKDMRYSAILNKGSARISLFAGPTPQTKLADQKLEESLDGEHEAVFAAQGDALTLWLDGKVVATAHDSTLPPGGFGVGLYKDDGGVKKVEYGELPEAAPGGASVTPTTATKDAPFENGLGMKFVPVPIIGGPTDGKTVLFSVWDTRVQDYEAFAKETKREWPKADSEQGPTDPVEYVSWEDAQAFCTWLTERERKAGRLGGQRSVAATGGGTDGAVARPSSVLPDSPPPPRPSSDISWAYRLPSDHEWSCAVGIGDKEDAAKLPFEKSAKIDDNFPWGTQWPPPKGAGNYAGEELQPALAAGKYSFIKDVLAGYNDGFVNTSPVGSFAANRFGLYDMGGNVWQWCEEWFDKEQKDRVLRGAAWLSVDRSPLLSSYRRHGVPGAHTGGYGFRCVLAPAAPPATVAAAKPPALPQWKRLTYTKEELRAAEVTLETNGEWSLHGTFELPGIQARNVAIRAEMRKPDGKNLSIHLRSRNGDSRLLAYYTKSALLQFHLHDHDNKDFPTLSSLDYAANPIPSDEWVPVEFAVVGERSFGKVRGVPFPPASSSEVVEAGVVTFVVAKTVPGSLRNVELLNLDGLSEAEALKAAGLPEASTTATPAKSTPAAALLSPSTEPWQDVLHDPAKLNLTKKGVEQTPEGLRFTGKGSVTLRPGQGPQRDGAVRMLATFGATRPHVIARSGNDGTYQLQAKDEKAIRLDRWDKAANRAALLREFPLPKPLEPGQDYELELRVVGQTLTAKLNGEILGTATDATVPEGSMGVWVVQPDAAPTLVKALEVLDLTVTK